jgi:hypothetical protein
MEGRYPPGVLLSLADCTEVGKEEEFNRWYDEILIPGIEDLGYVKNSRRYENVFSRTPTFQGRPKYLAVSEIYKDDLTQAIKDIHRREAEIDSGPKKNFSFVSKVNTVYRRIGPEFRTPRTGRAVRSAYCGLLACSDPARKDEFNKWYNERHATETIINDIFEFDTGYRYEVVDPNDPMPHQSSPYLTLYEAGAKPEATLKGLAGLRKNSLGDRLWVELLIVMYAGLFAPLKRQ